MDNFNTEKFYMKYKCYRSNAYFTYHRRKLEQETRVSVNYSICPSGEHSLRLLKETYAFPTCSSNSYGMDICNMHQRSPSIRLTNFDVLLTVHLSIFIFIINQLDA